MSTTSTTPNVAKLYRNYIAGKITDAAVKDDDPATRPRRLIVITSAPGGGSTDKPQYFTWRRVIVKTTATDDDTSYMLCESVRRWVVKSPREIAAVHKIVIVGEPGRFDDPDDTSPRYQMTFDVLVKPIPD